MTTWCTGVDAPCGIAVDSTGRAFVTSHSSNVVYVCSPMGGVSTLYVSLIATGSGLTPGQMGALALTRTGDLLIAAWNDGVDPKGQTGGVWRVNNTGAVCVFSA
jgi:hypothetical protein